MYTYQCDPLAEVSGQNVLALMKKIQASDSLLEKYQLRTINPEAWYPLQNVLNLLHELAERETCPTNFVALGAALAETTSLPALHSLDEIFMFFNDVY
ncbi:MAG: hypothetical protein K8I82_14280, partial [Anaerolineae bacterium]|nr:hypothetical protein [Anaerolineae bacterium]